MRIWRLDAAARSCCTKRLSRLWQMEFVSCYANSTVRMWYPRHTKWIITALWSHSSIERRFFDGAANWSGRSISRQCWAKTRMFGRVITKTKSTLSWKTTGFAEQGCRFTFLAPQKPWFSGKEGWSALPVSARSPFANQCPFKTLTRFFIFLFSQHGPVIPEFRKKS